MMTALHEAWGKILASSRAELGFYINRIDTELPPEVAQDKGKNDTFIKFVFNNTEQKN